LTTLDDFREKLNGEDASTAEARAAVGRWSKVSCVFEVLAFLFLGIGFIWTVAALIYSAP
jgi:hypothetical protein